MPGRVIHSTVEIGKDLAAAGAATGFFYAPFWEDVSPFLGVMSVVAGLAVSVLRVRAHIRKRRQQ